MSQQLTACMLRLTSNCLPTMKITSNLLNMEASIDFTKPKSNMVLVYLANDTNISLRCQSHVHSLTKISVTNSGGHFLTISVWFIKRSFSPAPCVMSTIFRNGNFKYNCYPYIAIICKTYLHINCRDCDTYYDSLIFIHQYKNTNFTFKDWYCFVLPFEFMYATTVSQFRRRQSIPHKDPIYILINNSLNNCWIQISSDLCEIMPLICCEKQIETVKNSNFISGLGPSNKRNAELHQCYS